MNIRRGFVYRKGGFFREGDFVRESATAARRRGNCLSANSVARAFLRLLGLTRVEQVLHRRSCLETEFKARACDVSGPSPGAGKGEVGRESG